MTQEDLPAVFWDEIPEDEAHPDAAAINALQAESTADERAETYKVQGNDALKRGTQLRKRFYLHEAINLYSKGLEMNCESRALQSILLSNRAHVHLLLCNNRNALEDSKAAISMDRHNEKAYYRGAKAAINLRQFDLAVSVCDKAVQHLESQPAEFVMLRKAALDAAQKQRDQDQQAAALAVQQRAPARKLALTLAERGWRVGLPQLSIGSRKPWQGDDGRVHWPVLFVYPETMQTDAVEDFCEDDTLGEVLDTMYGPDAPPLVWDKEHEYQQQRLQVYYLSHAATPLPVDQLTEVLHGRWPEGVSEQGPARYGSAAAQWVSVSDQAARLSDVLRKPDYVVPGIPVFFLVAEGTAFRERFVTGEFTV
ncbi:hypothetical protein WJX72_004164 [[Myrmecia] bisecta]|uniref:Cns1/TTC4 wheel domain-containing protein n=1 Tax=[Myrmecia] bisecta TaxID=41462 RepID=A0AAW1PEG2_9CHLO